MHASGSLETLMAASLSSSPNSSSSSCSSPCSLRIGIVGFGAFGQFIAKTLVKQGHSLSAYSRSDYSLICSQMGITYFREIDQFCMVEHDVILISTSILSFGDMLNLIPFHCIPKPMLMVDVLSVKEFPRDHFLQVLSQEFDILCTHPMFGPESGRNGWSGLPFMFDKVRISKDDHRSKICDDFLHIFKLEGCRMVEMSCEEHDQLAAQTQFITHTMGRILSELDIKPTPVDTKGFQSLLALRDNTMKDSFDLYSGLFNHNRFAIQEWLRLEHAIEAVKTKLLKDKDHALDAVTTKFLRDKKHESN
ncbi:arogenate dehydrogenase 1, chloroplastic [Amborella trichopoda]|uniref:arogenate dehydrogenase 1, chloroplastic n=1 Tax=Amborella trichopoda TaxID=13333 RepID=UPI0005D4177F|nr:arogenate dehydrogenase 1, chloroplastic [Amborella trichopoda]|eukprot:XP_011627086.1 arogenate dehydrogenase 1, chloroplastic [Amborella trichopoda]